MPVPKKDDPKFQFLKAQFNKFRTGQLVDPDAVTRMMQGLVSTGLIWTFTDDPQILIPTVMAASAAIRFDMVTPALDEGWEIPSQDVEEGSDLAARIKTSPETKPETFTSEDSLAFKRLGIRL